jgi:hypothetical protein
MDRRGFLGGIGGITCGVLSAKAVYANDESGVLSATSGMPGRPTVKVVGVGGAGGRILDEVIASKIFGIDQFVYINTASNGYSPEFHDKCTVDRQIVLGNWESRSREWRSAICVGELAMQESGRIAAAIADTDVVLLIAGMGGVAGTTIAPIVAGLARESGAFTIALLMTPCSYEGSRPLRAKQGIRLMQTITHWTKEYSNEAYLNTNFQGTTTRFALYRLVNSALIDDTRAALSVVGGGRKQ